MKADVLNDARPHERAEIAIAVPRGARTFVVPIVGGVGDLTRSLVLAGSARRLWRAAAAGDSVETLVAHLLACGAPSPTAAERDVAQFEDDLARHGIDLTGATRFEAHEEPDAEGSSNSTDHADTAASPDDVEAMARAVLARGSALRFVAHGESMRPMIPDGATLLVHPAQLDEPRVGDVVLYGTPNERLVAHRVVARKGGVIIARGDSAGRVDHVDRAHFLGVVHAVEAAGETRTDLHATPALLRATHGWPRRVGRLGRRPAAFVLRHGCRLLRGTERRATRMLRRFEILRAALLGSDEKHEGRQRLYAGKAVQDFTALDENVEAGLTLIEEVIFLRHRLPTGRALVLGCGPGRESFALADLGYDVVGIDTEPMMLEHARRGAERRGQRIDFREGAADAFDLGEQFDLVVMFSGLYNMILPRRRRVEALRAGRRHLAPGGRMVLTFLSGYVPPGRGRAVARPSALQMINPEHEDGDRFLLNEAVHLFPHPDDLRAEVADAGFDVEVLYRDQRAYDRAASQVRGYVVLEPSACAD